MEFDYFYVKITKKHVFDTYMPLKLQNTPLSLRVIFGNAFLILAQVFFQS